MSSEPLSTAAIASLRQRQITKFVEMLMGMVVGGAKLHLTSTELRAVPTYIDMRSREIQADIDAVRQGCLALGGCK